MRQIWLAAIGASLLAGCSTAQSEAFIGCGYAGAAIGSLVGDTDTAWKAGLGSAALCTIAATALDARREAVLEKEKELDNQIAGRKIDIEDIQAENRDLETRIARLESQAAQLETTRRENEEEAARIEGEIRGEQRAANTRIEIIEQRIAVVDAQLAQEGLSREDRGRLTNLKQLLKERTKIIERIQVVAT